ncbi:MAG: ATP-binding protein [Bacteroidetes bacterium]|nr:ATP-binding protein [Bacteroidota bacterium]
MLFDTLSVAWPYFLAALISGTMFLISKRLKKNATTNYFSLCVAAACFWSFFSGLHLVVPELSSKIFWSDLTYLAIAPLPVIWFVLALSYSRNRQDIQVRTIAWLSIIPLITLVLVPTNGLHYWVFGSASPLNTPDFSSFSRVFGPWFWVHTTFSYTLILAGIGIFARCMIQSQGHFRKQTIIMLIGSLIPLVFNAIYLLNDESHLRLDYTPVAFAATGAVYFLGLFKYKMLDLMPIARAEIVRSMEDAVIVTDMNGYILDTNESANQLNSSNNSPEIGKHIRSEFPFLEEYWIDNQATFRSSREIQRSSSPEEEWYRVDTKTILNSSKTPEGWLYVLRDISVDKRAVRQRQEAMKKLEEFSALKSAFVSNMSHDIRSPLAGIIGLADVLVEECEGEQLEFAAMIRDSGNQLFRVLNSMLSIVHLSSGTLDQNAEVINLTMLSRRVTSIVEREIAEKNVDFEVSLPEDVVEAEHDPNYLTHALTLILECSVLFTDQGKIQFDLKSDHDELVFQISDTGRGFEPAFQKSIYEALNVKEMANFGIDKGSELALRVANGLIEQMGGTLQITSELGVGTTFTVRLPSAWTPVEASVPVDNPLPSSRSRIVETKSNPDPVH